MERKHCFTHLDITEDYEFPIPSWNIVVTKDLDYGLLNFCFFPSNSGHTGFTIFETLWTSRLSKKKMEWLNEMHL